METLYDGEVEQFLQPYGRKLAAHFFEILQAAVYVYEGYGNFMSGNIYWCYAINAVVGALVAIGYFYFARRMIKNSNKQLAGFIFNPTDVNVNAASIFELVALFAWIPIGLIFDSYGVFIPYIVFSHIVYLRKKGFVENILIEKGYTIKKDDIGYSILSDGFPVVRLGERLNIEAETAKL